IGIHLKSLSLRCGIPRVSGHIVLRRTACSKFILDADAQFVPSWMDASARPRSEAKATHSPTVIGRSLIATEMNEQCMNVKNKIRLGLGRDVGGTWEGRGSDVVAMWR